MIYVNSVPTITGNNVCPDCATKHPIKVALAWCDDLTKQLKKNSLDPNPESEYNITLNDNTLGELT
jgi:hypothetical protein